MSHPVWVCGLKLYLIAKDGGGGLVTPCMGVWIETFTNKNLKVIGGVTPCMGVWIETLSTL